MVDISTELASILSDARGEDVRDSFVSACEKINKESLPYVTEGDSGRILAVNADGEWAALSITPVLSSIAVTTQPDKTVYEQGDVLDLTGIVITATKTSDLLAPVTEDVTSDCAFTPDDGETLDETGTIEVSVIYIEGDKTATTSFEITVNEVVAEGDGE